MMDQRQQRISGTKLQRRFWQGSKRERVRLAGNAVTPPAARDIVAAGLRSIDA